MNGNTNLVRAELTPDVISFLETGNVAMAPDGTAYYSTLKGVYVKRGEDGAETYSYDFEIAP